MIVANPPYLDAQDPHLREPTLSHEPREALIAAQGGLEALTRIARGARARLSAGGHLYLEHGANQAGAVLVPAKSGPGRGCDPP